MTDTWREELKGRIAVQEELDRINAKPVQSHFEEMVKNDVYKSSFFDYNKSWKENVELYWKEKLS